MATEESSRSPSPQRARRAIGLFLGLAFGLSWAWEAPLVLTGHVVQPGQGWPTHLPALFGPAVAGIAATAYLHGRPGLRDLVRRTVRLTPWLWIVPATLAIGVLALVAQYVANGTLPPPEAYWTYSGAPVAHPLLVVGYVLLLNGFGEEIGWRGFLTDHLLARHSPVVSALLVAVPWALWHLPMFWCVAGLRGLGPSAIGWLLGLTSAAIVMTWLYRVSHSVLLLAAWHTSFNFTSATLGTGGLVAATTSTLVMMAAVAILLRWTLARRGREAGVTGDRARPVS